jgi:hypothetical protein
MQLTGLDIHDWALVPINGRVSRAAAFLADGVSVALVGSRADPIFAAFAGLNSGIVLVMGGAHGT